MNTRARHLTLILLCVSGCGRPTVPVVPSKADIPKDWPAELKHEVERTFSEDAQERAQAALRLREMGKRAVPAIPFLIRLLPDCEGRETLPRTPGSEADVTLLALGDAIVEPLIAVLQAEHQELGPFVADLLNQIDGPKARDALIDALGAQSVDIQTHAIWALERRKEQRAVAPLIAIVKNQDAAATVRDSAAGALGEIGDPRAVDPLIAIVKNPDAPTTVRDSAAGALGGMRDPRGVEPLTAILDDAQHDAGLRASAARALGELAAQPTTGLLLATLKDKSENVEVRDAAAYALGSMNDPQAAPLLLSVFQDENEDMAVRFRAASALAKLRDPRGLDALRTILSDKRQPGLLRRSVAEVLGHTSDARSIQAAATVLHDEQEQDWIRTSALDGLACSEHELAFGHAITALSDADEVIREEAVRVLVQGTYSSSLFLMFDTWEAPDTILPALKDPRVIDPLIALLTDTTERTVTRGYAALALAKTRSIRARAPLREALKVAPEPLKPIIVRALREIETLSDPQDPATFAPTQDAQPTAG